MAGNVASLYDNGGMIGATLDLGSTEQYVTGSTGGTPSIVGTASANGANSVSLTGITGLAEGDLVLACITSDNSTENTTITSSGWTAISDNVFSASINTTIAYKVMGATVDTSIGITSVVDAITVIAMSDVEYLSGASVTGSAFFSSINPPSVTVASDDSIVLVLAAIDDDNSTISSPPTGYTTAVQDGRLGGSNAIMYKTGVSAGTEDPDTLTWSSADTMWAVTLEFGPTSSATYGNYKNSGIWSMDAVYELLRPVGISLFATATDNLSDGHGTVFPSFTLTWPSNIQSGMVAVLLASRDFTTNDIATPTGFTLLTQDTTSGGTSAEGYIFYRECDGTETGNITITSTSTGFYGPAAVMAVFNVGGNFSGMSETSVLLTTGDDPDPPSHTATSASQYIGLAMAVYDDGPQYGITDVDVPTGYTKAVEWGTLASNGTSSSWVVIAYKLNASQTENPSAFSQNGMTAIQDTIGYTAAIEIG
jgi:hypothetical protein